MGVNRIAFLASICAATLAAQINPARDNEGASPLDDAVWRKSLDGVAILVAHGAKLNDPDLTTGATDQ